MPELDALQIVLLLAAGLMAGLINTVVGSGTLVSFPVLLAFGYPPVLANVTNNVGVLPGSISGAVGYRHELKGQWRSIIPLILAAATGGVVGALLLLVLPSEVFDGVVPVLIVIACVLVVIGPALKRRAAVRNLRLAERDLTHTLDADDHQRNRHATEGAALRESTVLLVAATLLTGMYGGYFGAAQGVILLAILSILLRGSIQRANAVKNVLAASANLTASFIFVALTQIDWVAAGLIALGAVVGGQVGAKVGRKIPDNSLRALVVIVGISAIIVLYFD